MALMFKLGAGLLLLATAAVLAFTDFGGYARYEIRQAGKNVVKLVPAKTQIGALKNKVADLDGPINAQKDVLAEHRVAHKHAKAEQTTADADADKLHTELAALYRQIGKAKPGCELADQKDEFALKYGRLEAAKARAAGAEKAAASAEEAARAAESLLQEMLKERDALVRQLSELEALQGEVLIEEARTQSRGGDSDAAAIRARADEIRTQLEVRKERTTMNGAKPTGAAKDYDAARKAWEASK